MKQLDIPFLDFNKDIGFQVLSSTFDNGEKHRITSCPWPEYQYVPEVSFAIAHGKDCLFLKYFVSENTVRAKYGQINDPVYKDSCVEFFIAFGKEDNYYNFEFNCEGIGLLGYGAGKENRKLLDADLIGKIRTWPFVQHYNGGGGHWQLALIIPFEVFEEHQIVSLHDQVCRVNFYKCGDDLPQPHFLCWNPVQTLTPDFHRPEYFGSARFLSVEHTGTKFL